MKQYIGTKIVEAIAMTKNTFDSTHGIPVSSNQEDMLGYKVVYEDGYMSWSPLEAFEGAYRLTNGMNFGLAIEAMKKGIKVTRTGWNGKDMYLELQTPDENSKMSLPYIYMKTVQGNLVPWLASQTDMLSDDWCFYVPESTPEVVNPADTGNCQR